MGKIYRDEVLHIAAEELGYLEKATDRDLDSKTANPGNGNWTKYARDLWQAVPHYYQSNKNGYDWCCVFVDWCVYIASGRDSVRAQAAKYFTGPYGAGCDWCVKYYKEAGAWYADPKPGDQIFFGSAYAAQHTGHVTWCYCYAPLSCVLRPGRNSLLVPTLYNSHATVLRPLLSRQEA